VVAIPRVVAGTESSAIVVPVRLERPVAARKPLIGVAVVAVADRIVAAAVPPVLLRMPEPVGIAASKRRFLVDASGQRNGVDALRADAAAPLGAGSQWCEEDENGKREPDEPNHQSARRKSRQPLQCKRYARKIRVIYQ